MKLYCTAPHTFATDWSPCHLSCFSNRQMIHAGRHLPLVEQLQDWVPEVQGSEHEHQRLWKVASCGPCACCQASLPCHLEESVAGLVPSVVSSVVKMILTHAQVPRYGLVSPSHRKVICHGQEQHMSQNLSAVSAQEAQTFEGQVDHSPCA